MDPYIDTIRKLERIADTTLLILGAGALTFSVLVGLGLICRAFYFVWSIGFNLF